MSDCQWFVVRTNPRCEERAVASIGEAGFETYAPKLPRLIIHHRSKKAISREFPMLVGYVFVALPRRYPPFGEVRACNGVKAFLGVNGEPQEMTPAEMEAVRDIEGSEWLRHDLALRAKRKLPKTRRRATERAIIKSGPFSGFMGHVVDGKDKRAVKVVTNAFSKLVEITIPEAELERAA